MKGEYVESAVCLEVRATVFIPYLVKTVTGTFGPINLSVHPLEGTP